MGFSVHTLSVTTTRQTRSTTLPVFLKVYYLTALHVHIGKHYYKTIKSGVVVGNNQLLLHLLLARQEIDALFVELGAARPQALQIVELAILLEEQVHDPRADVDGAPLPVVGQATLEHNFVVVLEPLVALVELDEMRESDESSV